MLTICSCYDLNAGMSLDQPITAKPEPDYDPDEAMVLLTELQIRDLGKIRQIGMDLLDDLSARGGDASLLVKGRLDLAYERISKMVLQVAAMEQHTLKVRAGARATLKTERAVKKKAAVKREVEAVLDAVAKAPAAKVGPEAAKVAALPKLPRLNLLNDIFHNYDFSDPRTVATMVAEICGNLGIPFNAEIWPVAAGGAAEAVKPIETVKPAVKPSPPFSGRPPFELGSVSSIGLMAQSPSGAKGRGPP